MPMDERTGKRPKNYSIWHRNKLPEWCKMTDGDYFEQREIDGELRAVAYMETIQVSDVNAAQMGRYPVWPSKDALCKEIQRKVKIPSFIVYHNPKCDDFLVFSYTNHVYTRMTEEEYINFIKGLTYEV